MDQDLNYISESMLLILRTGLFVNSDRTWKVAIVETGAIINDVQKRKPKKMLSIMSRGSTKHLKSIYSMKWILGLC
jgi:hypothetical protein